LFIFHLFKLTQEEFSGRDALLEKMEQMKTTVTERQKYQYGHYDE
jgi:hypothetical protein